MPYENDIIDAVCDYLKNQGFTIERRCRSTERGDDIVASHGNGLHLYIEAKGEGSARAGSARYGKQFNGGQVFDVVAKAFYRAAAMLQQSPNGQKRCSGLALPDTVEFRQRVAAIDQALLKLGLLVFWINPDRTVTTSMKLPL